MDRFGRLVLGAVVVLVGVSCGGSETELPPLARFPATGMGDTLQEPHVVRSVPTVVGNDTINILDATVEVVMNRTTLPGRPDSVTLRAYKLTEANGVAYNEVGFPGPTFWVHPGDSVRINLVNRLPADGNNHDCLSYAATQASPPIDTFPDCFHGSNYTNLHYHGSHITPQGQGDNVLISIGPDSSWQSAFRIPLDQSPGTMWYHPHKHGSVALQVTNGMAGALVIEGGGLDSLTNALRMTQHLLAVQEVDTTLNLLASSKPPPGLTLVDGQLDPTVRMRPGEVQRWRFVNENAHKTVTYQLLFADSGGVRPQMFDIARDGVQYAPANYDAVIPDTVLFIAPGNRLDVFVRAPTSPGTYHLRGRPTGRLLGRRFQVGELRAGAGLSALGQQLVATGQELLTVQVVNDSATVNTTLPASLPPLPAFLANLDTVGQADTAAFIVFSDDGFGSQSHEDPTRFWLGTRADSLQKFDPDSVFLHMPLDSTQTWKVINASTGINHPIHIHINPFQVLKVVYDSAVDANWPYYKWLNEAAAGGNPVWLDTFALPLSNTTGAHSYAVIRQQYKDFTGQYVMHCHILGHEERGMMQLLEVDSTVVRAGSDGDGP